MVTGNNSLRITTVCLCSWRMVATKANSTGPWTAGERALAALGLDGL
jgi:hypothetical protein